MHRQHYKLFKMKAWLSVARDIQREFSGLTIENIIQQLEAIIEHLNKRT